MSTREEIGRRIRHAREEKGLSQADLGRLMSRQRSYAAISDLERGKTALASDELVELARILDRDVSYFLPTSASTATAVWLRGGYGLSSEGQRETNEAISRFQDIARQKARQKRREDQ